MHGDLQDDPNLITEMVKSWEDGNEQVLVRYLPKKRESYQKDWLLHLL